MLPDVFGILTFAAELLEYLGLRMLLGDPSGEGVGEENAGALVVGEARSLAFQQRGDLQVGDDEGSGHDLEAEDACKGDGPEIVWHTCRIVSCIFKQRAMNAVENLGEIGSGAAARVEDADSGAGKAEWLIEFSAKEMVHPLDHVLDDFFWGVPNAEFLAKFRVERFKEGS